MSRWAVEMVHSDPAALVLGAGPLIEYGSSGYTARFEFTYRRRVARCWTLRGAERKQRWWNVYWASINDRKPLPSYAEIVRT